MRQHFSRALVTGVVLAGLGGTAYAADLGDYQAPEPVDPGPVVSQAPAIDWTGFRAGVDLGWGWVNADGNAFGGKYSGSDNGLLGGVHAGYDYQVSPNAVIGVEADILGTDLKSTDRAAGVPVRNSIDWMSTVRARGGFTYDQFLIYGTGGIAFGGVETKIPGASKNETRVGYTVGGGAEAMLTDNISTRLEYLYTDFGDDGVNVGGTRVKSDVDAHVLKAGLSYKF